MRVQVQARGRAVAISVHGALDAAVGATLLAETRSALDTLPARIDIDLRAVGSHTEEGAAALVACRTLCATLPDGLHFRTDAGPGGEALLAAFSTDSDHGAN